MIRRRAPYYIAHLKFKKSNIGNRHAIYIWNKIMKDACKSNILRVISQICVSYCMYNVQQLFDARQGVKKDTRHVIDNSTKNRGIYYTITRNRCPGLNETKNSTVTCMQTELTIMWRPISQNKTLGVDVPNSSTSFLIFSSASKYRFNFLEAGMPHMARSYD